ncbi:MAG: ABC transporter ATP-binding protein [Acidobacteriota bacterium]
MTYTTHESNAAGSSAEADGLYDGSHDDEAIIFDNVSKFYGDVLGVNRISLTLPGGITGLVGPNGSGKSTLMNLVAGLLQPTEGTIRVLGITPDQPDRLFGHVGYLTQFDSFPPGVSGYRFIYNYLRIHGMRHAEADAATWKAIDRVGLREAAKRKAGGYSKGMRQRIRLAQAIAHEPRVLVLDEPLNGLDPMARSHVIDIFKSLAEEGCHVLISSHVLHEVDMVSDRVVLLSSGYVVAEGEVDGVRHEMHERPIQVLVRCDHARLLASKLFTNEGVVEVAVHDDGGGLLVQTKDASSFYSQMNALVLEHDIAMETITIADSDVRAVYAYLIEQEGESP